MRTALVGIALLVSGCAVSPPQGPGFHLIPGSVPLGKGPDGNTIILEGSEGLIVVDTGRHPEHAQAILDYSRQRGRPIAAIVNTHWHLDHTTGNLDVRQVYPGAAVYATNAVDGALATYLQQGRDRADEALSDPKTTPDERAQILRGRYRVDHPDTLRPTRPVLNSGSMDVAGRKFDVRVAPFAATEADLWIYDRKEKLAIVGDLVVGIVPFMDTACPDGWAKALEEIGKTPFQTLIPGHGSPMTRAQFEQWASAFTNFVACGRSAADKSDCIAGWEKDAAQFIDGPHRDYVRRAADYYITTRLRSPIEEQERYCRPLKPAA